MCILCLYHIICILYYMILYIYTLEAVTHIYIYNYIYIFSLSPLSQAFTPKISGAFVSSSEGGAEKNLVMFGSMNPIV